VENEKIANFNKIDGFARRRSWGKRRNADGIGKIRRGEKKRRRTILGKTFGGVAFVSRFSIIAALF
jgi:hypothetical protein